MTDLNTLRRMAGVAEVFFDKNKLKEDVTQGIGEPIKHGGKYSFYLVTGATKHSTLADVISEVDTVAFARIATGSKLSKLPFSPKNESWELFPHDKQKEALTLATQRLKKAQTQVTESSNFEENCGKPHDEDEEENVNYSKAIAHREQLLNQLRTNSPTNWTPEYIQKNIDFIEKEIENFKTLSGKEESEEDEEGLEYSGSQDKEDTIQWPKEVKGRHPDEDDWGMNDEAGDEDEEAMNYKSSLIKGQQVEYEGKPYIVVVPDAKADFVGIAPIGKEDDPDAVDLVRARKIMSDEEEEEVVMNIRMEDTVMKKIKVGDYVEYQPMNGNQPRGKSKNVRITKILDDDKYEISSGKVIKKREIQGINLKETEVEKVVCKICKKKISQETHHDHMKNAHPDVDPTKEEKGAMPLYTKEGAVDATVWDAAMNDKDESPENPPRDEVKFKIPSKIKNLLKVEIKQLHDESEKIKISDKDRSDFYKNSANAMQTLLEHLEKGTREGVKDAQIFMTSLMGPILQRIPDDVYDFITGGGEPATLKALFTKVKMEKR